MAALYIIMKLQPSSHFSSLIPLTQIPSEPFTANFTNNVSRLSIKSDKMGLRNYHFHTSESGADAASGFYSLIQSCEMLEVNPYVYLTSVLKAKAVNAFEDAELTPLEWKKRYEKGEISKELLPLELIGLFLSLPK